MTDEEMLAKIREVYPNAEVSYKGLGMDTEQVTIHTVHGSASGSLHGSRSTYSQAIADAYYRLPAETQ